MQKYLIVYATNYGQTEKIAGFIAQKILKKGLSYDSFSINHLPRDLSPKDYCGTIVGAPVYRGRYATKLRKWCLMHHEILNQSRSAFFSVCLGVLQNDSQVQIEENRIMQKFLCACRWKPGMCAIFAGSLNYSKYNWLMKWVLYHIAKKAGQETSTNRDYEYTDWGRVEKFVEDFLQNS